MSTLGEVRKIDFSKAKPGQTIATVKLRSDGTYTEPHFERPPVKHA